MKKMRECKNNVLTKEQKEFILNNYENMTNDEISEKLNISKYFIHNYASNNHLIKNQNKRLVKHGIYKEILKKDFSHIYKSMNNSIEPTINSNLLYKSKYGKYYINQDYFNIIDNEWKAYWLGFLYADGTNRIKWNEKKHKMEHVLKLTLCYKDKTHLEKFKKSLQNDSPIKDRIIKLNNKEFKSCDINICNQKICNDLSDLGCVPNKSLILKFPNDKIVPKNLIRHFIRGYFDGDGCVHVNLSNKSTVINFVGTKEFLSSLQDIFHNELKISYTKMTNQRNNKAFQITYGGIEEFEKIFTYLYKDSNIYLDRKLEKFKIIL